MIVRMSKIVIIGPLELLMDTLALLQEMEIMEVDEEISPDMNSPARVPRIFDREAVLQHQYYEKLEQKINTLRSFLPSLQYEHTISLAPLAIDTLVAILPDHLDDVTKRREALDELDRQIDRYEKYRVFLEALASLSFLGSGTKVECIGIRFKRDEDIAGLEAYLEGEYQGRIVLERIAGQNKKDFIGILLAEKGEAERVRKELGKWKVDQFQPPDGLGQKPLPEQQKAVERALREKRDRRAQLQEQQEAFTRQWLPVYRSTSDWLEAQRALIKVTGAVTKTRMCFFIHGWLPKEKFPSLAEKLRSRFEERVVIEEVELAEQDFSRIPTALDNPEYFRPFELLARLLPMPPYASFDLTPFIGIFFPVFFGMMLGDIGYGLILLGGSVYLIRNFTARPKVQDGGRILFICSFYTIVFGILYGEFFGSVGHDYLGLKPIIFDRQASIVPMLCFAVAVGVVHVLVGLVLGIIVSLRRNMRKEAVFKLANIFLILCIVVLLVSHFTESIVQVQKPLLLAVAVVSPLLLLVGGLLAPLELLKNIGNIISYARIMAVGLTSVLLAFVANYMAGRIGSVWAGIIVALLLHAFNLLLGVFAPTIHSLRLHYVEFLSKFMEPGGKEFKPLGKKQ